MPHTKISTLKIRFYIPKFSCLFLHYGDVVVVVVVVVVVGVASGGSGGSGG